MPLIEYDVLTQAEDWRRTTDLREFVTPALKDDPAHWLSRAEEARVVSEVMTDPDIKRKMVGIAEMYDRLAQHAKERAGRDPKNG